MFPKFDGHCICSQTGLWSSYSTCLVHGRMIFNIRPINLHVYAAMVYGFPDYYSLDWRTNWSGDLASLYVPLAALGKIMNEITVNILFTSVYLNEQWQRVCLFVLFFFSQYCKLRSFKIRKKINRASLFVSTNLHLLLFNATVSVNCTDFFFSIFS